MKVPHQTTVGRVSFFLRFEAIFLQVVKKRFPAEKTAS